MLEENNKMACWNVCGFCYGELIIFLNIKSSVSQCMNALLHLSEKSRRLNASQRFLAPNQQAFSIIVAGKRCIVGDPASSGTLVPTS